MRAALSRIVAHPLAALALIAALLGASPFLSEGTLQILCFVLIGTVFAQSISLLTGAAGLMSLGQAGFFGVGAYTAGILAKRWGLEPLLTVPAGALAAAACGYLLSFPAGRVRDVYLAMMTLGFGMVFFEVVREWNDLTGGMMGLPGVPSAALRTLRLAGFPVGMPGYFAFVLLGTAAFLWGMGNVARSRVGRSFLAIHHSEVAAGSLGIARGRCKQLAFLLSGGAAGLAGGFYAHLVGYLGPDSFGLNRSVEVLVVSIVGGLGSIPGQVLGSVLFTFLPEKLQVFADYQYMVYGLILTFSLVLLPRGLAGLVLLPPRFIRPAALRRARALDGTLPRAPPAPACGTVVEAEGITLRFGGLTALDGVSLSLRAGRITALVGPNGSGKSTLVNVIGGLYRPVAGRLRIGGRDMTGRRDHEMARAGLIRTFQDPRLVPDFTVRENLLLGTHRLPGASGLAAALALPGATAAEAAALARVEAVIRLIDLGDVADRQLDTLPYGFRRLTDVGRALLANPAAVLLDEPAAGLSEPETERLARLIRDMRDMGIAVLVIDHHMDFLAGLADEVVVLDSGRQIFRGTMDGMRQDRAVIEAYLGAPHEEPGVA